MRERSFLHAAQQSRAHCHYFKNVRLSVCKSFSLYYHLKSTGISNQRTDPTFCGVFLPVHLHTPTGFCCSPSLLWEEHLYTRGSEVTRCVRDEHKVIPRHPSFPSCHLPLRQLHFLSSSLGLNSCTPASHRSQEEGCALPKVERNDILVFSGEEC